ncbi:MAG: biotin/lipoyl-binding protein [Nitratireductor sp.]|nr:biotin/lipoyl-binding protein [Nitratireductor sp.]
MIAKLLIANRGEIACRIARTARRMGVASVAVFTEADRDAPHVRACDEAVRTGSYLDIAGMVEAATRSGAHAVHPGYGFLSENADFAEACAQAGIVFVGPSPEAIRIMGDKAAAKAKMIEAGVPVVPGYQGECQELATLLAEAEKIGFPVLIKAAAGGGGRGMRRVHAAWDFGEALASARREAKSAFGNDSVLLERLVEDGRHVEVQVFGDAHGNMVHLYERDCSTQRRHQKIIEECPSPAVSAELRDRLGEWAVAAAQSVGYRGAGTVEFILDKAGNAFFLEMNTRLQVEHPVTEMVTGVDLVEWQLRVASGEGLPLTQDQIEMHGHAVEARLYAEDPYNGFLPQTGRVLGFRPRGGRGERIDAGIEEGGEIGAAYDPMVAKFIAHGADRAEAVAKLVQLICDVPLTGFASNAGFLVRLLRSAAFSEGDMTTATIDRWTETGDAILTRPEPAADAWLAAACVAALAPGGNWFRSSGVAEYPVMLECGEARETLRLVFERGRLVQACVKGSEIAVDSAVWDGEVLRLSFDGLERRFRFFVDGACYHLARDGEVLVLAEPDLLAGKGAQADPGRVVTPASGRVARVSAAVGDAVEEGAALVVIEAMKMETALVARASGVITAVHVKEGDQVQAGETIIEIGT